MITGRRESSFRLVTLDLDGTMFRGNSILFLKEKGLLNDNFEILHERFRRGEINEQELNRLQFPLLKGVKLDPLFEELSNGPLLVNIQQGVDALKSRGLEVSMLSFNPLQLFFGRKYGIDCSLSKFFEIRDGKISESYEVPANKVVCLKKYCADHEIKLKECVHIGDGMNDIQTFGAVGFSIALNGRTHDVEKSASTHLETDDFALVANEILSFSKR
jgi:phosphoserine phosphatase